jgi:hypothetical protein
METCPEYMTHPWLLVMNIITGHQGYQGRFGDGLPGLPVRNVKQVTVLASQIS